LPDFFWANKVNFLAPKKELTPALGRAWYTDFCGDEETSRVFAHQLQATRPLMDQLVPHINAGIERYDLKQRLASCPK
jgi:hypothetical protein